MGAPNWDDLKPVGSGVSTPMGSSGTPNWDDLKPVGSGMPSHEEVNQGLGSIRQRLIANLLPAHNDSSYSPYKPADPQHMPNDAINPVGTDAQMRDAITTAGLGSIGGPRANIETPAPPPAAPPAPPGPNPFQLPMRVTPSTQGMPAIRGPGGKFMPNPQANQPAGLAPTAPQPPPAQNPFQGGPGGVPSNPITNAPPLPGTSPEQMSYLKQAMAHGTGLGRLANPMANILGAPAGPYGHLGMHALFKMLGM